jgi:hypothetical protein
MKKLIYVFCLISFFKNSSSAQDTIAISRPWGFYSIYWSFESNLNEVQRIDIPIIINEDVPDEYQLFVQVAQGKTENGRVFYGGLQTNVGNEVNDSIYTDEGNGAIFSRWAQNDGKQDEEKLTISDVSDYQFYEIDDYEGSFCSVRRKMKFDKGSYILSFIKEGTWINYEVNNVLIGKINFKDEKWNLKPYLSAFLEIYGGGNNKNDHIESNEIPYINITFNRPVITTSNNFKLKPIYALIQDYGKNDSNSKVANNITTSVKTADGISVVVDWENLIYSTKEVRKWILFEDKHIGLKELKTDMPYRIFYSEGYIQQAQKNAELLKEAYLFLSDIMGPKENLNLLVVSKKDWSRNAYEKSVWAHCFLEDIVVCPEKDNVTEGLEAMILSFPKEMTKELFLTFSDENGELDMRLHADKLLVHELTHCFQNFCQSRSLQELYANMGLYAFYKSRRPDELKYITQVTDFFFANLPTDFKYKTLLELDTHGSDDMTITNYGYYQMKLTKAAQKIIDTYGNGILKSLNDFFEKYDYEELTIDDYKKKLAVEIDPGFAEILNKLDQ